MTPLRASRRGAVRQVLFLPDWHDNPYQHLLASGLSTLGVAVRLGGGGLAFLATALRHGRPDVVHFHTPEHYVVYRRSLPAAVIALAAYVSQVVVLRLLGVAVVWTAHDLLNHERRRPGLDALCRRATVRLANAVIVHCRVAGARVGATFGPRPSRVHVVPHGHYLNRYPEFPGDAAAARVAAALPADGPIVLFLGNLRRHKGVERLLDDFGRIGRPDTWLVVAGQPFDAGIRDEITRRAAGRADVLLRLGFVPDAAVGMYLRAADLVVCPFTHSLTSGSLTLALSFGKAVVVPRLGCAPEMVPDGGGFLYDPAAPDGLVTALQSAIDARGRLAAMGTLNREHVRRHDWATIARRTLEVYDGAATG